jgi:hypothetical protein
MFLPAKMKYRKSRAGKLLPHSPVSPYQETIELVSLYHPVGRVGLWGYGQRNWSQNSGYYLGRSKQKNGEI